MPVKIQAIGESSFLGRSLVATPELLFRQLCFTPLAREGTVLALCAAFLASAMAHVLLVFMPMGRWPVSIVCGAFFAVQPLLIVSERAMRVRRWPRAAARIWVFLALGVTSPLFVEPAIRIVFQSPIGTNTLFLPVAVVLGYALLVNAVFLVGQLAFCVKPLPPQAGLEPTPG